MITLDRATRGRRAFLGTAAMTLAAAELGGLSMATTGASASRQLAAVGDAPPGSTRHRCPPRACSASLPSSSSARTRASTGCEHFRTFARGISGMGGLTVIGVHTPEFAFEKDVANVSRAMQRLHVGFPVVLDNDYAIWRAFDNHYWPALYLLDARGGIRYRHFGEGEYQQSGRAIERLLADTADAVDTTGQGDRGGSATPVAATAFEVPADSASLRSPEIVSRARPRRGPRVSGRCVPGERRAYRIPARLDLNRWALDGEWTIERQPAVLGSADGRIVCRFHARDVHLVMGPARRGEGVRFRVSVDGQPPGAARGVDVDEHGAGIVAEQRLHQLIRQRGPVVERTFEIAFLDAGVEAFAFTFG